MFQTGLAMVVFEEPSRNSWFCRCRLPVSDSTISTRNEVSGSVYKSGPPEPKTACSDKYRNFGGFAVLVSEQLSEP